MSGAGKGRPSLPVLQAQTSRNDPLAGVAAAAGASIRVVTLGCDKNTVDSERLLASLTAAGGETTDSDDVDVIVINTCGFIDAAREESVDVILEALRLKAAGRVRAVAAVGCLVQRYRDELETELPEVDLFLGLTEADRLVPELRARGFLAAEPPAMAAGSPIMERPLRQLTGATRHMSWLKISEGCDHTCAFCAIPLMRGRHRSTALDVLVAEAVELERAGVVELGLVSQDTTWYGRDLQRGGDPATAAESFVGRPFPGMAGLHTGALHRPSQRGGHAPAGNRRGQLPELLKALLSATSIPWIRLFYMYPSGIQRDLVELIAGEPRIVNYLDMPLQHGADSMLERMRRPERSATIRERVHWLRDAIPDIALRTTVIVGFPGETDAEFDALLDLLEEIRFDHVGAFAWSVEEGTPAATMPDRVSESLKRERIERLTDLQRSLSLERNEALVGAESDIIIDRVAGRTSSLDPDHRPAAGAVGRSPRQAWEIDGVVHISDAGDVRAGDFVRVRFTDAVDHDLVAERVEREAGD